MSTEEDDRAPQTYLQRIRALYPDEFTDKEPTLAQYLQEADEIIAIEENYLDKPPMKSNEEGIKKETEAYEEGNESE